MIYTASDHPSLSPSTRELDREEAQEGWEEPLVTGLPVGPARPSLIRPEEVAEVVMKRLRMPEHSDTDVLRLRTPAVLPQED